GIATMLFLGGWNTGLVPVELSGTFLGYIVGNLINVLVFIFKGFMLVFVMMWVRWTLPRLRIDQVMMACLKYLLPISCALLLGVSVWRLVVLDVVQDWFRFVLLAACVVAVALVVKQWITWASLPPGAGMPGMWRMTGVTG